MTSENAASGPPWPAASLPWPKLGSLKDSGLEAVWALGPVDGPVTHFGSARDPRKVWGKLRKASAVPLVVHDLRWGQGSKGRALARALRLVNAGPISPAVHRFTVEVEAARLGVTLASHVDVVQAVEAHEKADLDAFLSRCHPGKSKDEIEAIRQESAEGWDSARQEYRDELATAGHARWEANFRRTNGTRPKKLFQRNRKIASLYRNGMTLREIGTREGLSFGRVREILHDHGVDLRPRGGHMPRRGTAA